MSELKVIERDKNGLIKGIDYKFTDDGLIDWRRMIPVKYLYLDNDPKSAARIEKKYGKPISLIDIEKDNIADSHLRILLGGLKYLARIRGYESVSLPIIQANDGFAAVNCKINFIGNFETEGKSILFEDNACAHLNNTTNFAKQYLVEMASNRAFCRCVRSFLNINIVSKEEIQGGSLNQDNDLEVENDQPVILFESLMKKKNITFKQLKTKIVAEKMFDGVDSISSVKDIPKDKLFQLIPRLEKFNPS
jgi:hypothetical protein